jgi:hypothetical protein
LEPDCKEQRGAEITLRHLTTKGQKNFLRKMKKGRRSSMALSLKKSICLHVLGIMVQTCNPSTWEVETKDIKFKASLGYIASPCIKEK